MGANIMLAVHCKKAEPLELKGPVQEYIAATYGDSAAQDAAEDLETIQGQRAQIVGMGGSLPSLRDLMAKYYRALVTMETRFPISKDASHIHLSFIWYDAFRPTKRYEQPSIHLEKAAVLFNLGALQSQIALQTERSTDAGVKDAAKLFQEASGTFGYLRDVASVKVEAPRPVDVGPECTGMLAHLMLAQAQECVLEKAIMDKKSPALLARIAKQVSVLYHEVAVALQAQPLAAHFDKTWGAHIGVKAGALLYPNCAYEVTALLESANAMHADDKIGAEITRLREAQKLLQPVKKDARACSKELQDTAKALEEVLARNLAKAERENATVYLQRIPPGSELAAVAGALLVKPIVPHLDASREGLFTSVIPDNSAKALSKYTDLVDSLARQQRELLEGASDEARVKLREWELPEALNSLDAGSVAALPEGLRVELEGIEDAGGVRFLQEMAAQIRELRRVATEELDKAEGQLNEEADEDAGLRAQHGAAWNRPASAALNSSLREKVASYRSNLAAAGDSDTRLEAKLASNAAGFAALTVDAAASQMPRLQAPMVAVGDADPAVTVATLRQALEALTRLSADRAGLEEALKTEKDRDNILPRIMASSDNYDALFQEELKKYDQLKTDICANCERQAELLAVLAQQQAAFRSAFGFADWRRACEGASAGVRAQADAFREVRNNLSEGLRFYMSLQEAIVTLQQQIGDFCLTRRIQREEMVEEQRRRLAEEERNRRAAQDFSRMTLGGGGAQPAAPHAPQHYPPAYQSSYAAPAPAPAHPQQAHGPPPTHAPPPPSNSLPLSAYSQQQQPQPQHLPQPPQPSGHYPPYQLQQPAHQQQQQQHQSPPAYQPYGQPYGAPQQPQQYGAQPSYGNHPAYGQPPPSQQPQQPQHQYGYGGVPAQQYGSYGAPQQPQQNYYSYGQQQPPPGGPPPPQQQQSSGTNPLWSG